MVQDRIKIARFVTFAALWVSLTCVNAQEPPPAEPDPANTPAPNPPPAQTPAQDSAVTEAPLAPLAPPTGEAIPQELPADAALTEATAPPSEPPIKGCEDQADLRAWIDKLHSSLYRFSCSSVSWFDGLFGSRQFDNEYRQTHGTVTVGGQWSKLGGVEKTLRFRGRF
jgi:hypothetical protein